MILGNVLSFIPYSFYFYLVFSVRFKEVNTNTH